MNVAMSVPALGLPIRHPNPCRSRSLRRPMVGWKPDGRPETRGPRTGFVAAAAIATVLSVGVVDTPMAAAGSREVGRAGRIRQQDLPSGWLEKTPDGESPIDVDELIDEIPGCRRVERVVKDESRARAKSPEFEMGDNE